MIPTYHVPQHIHPPIKVDLAKHERESDQRELERQQKRDIAKLDHELGKEIR